MAHTFGTMGTGGFSTLNRSIGGFESAYIDYVIIVFMFIAGSSFALHYRFLRGDWRAHIRDYEFRWYVSVMAVAFVIIGIDTFVFRYDNVARRLPRYAVPGRLHHDHDRAMARRTTNCGRRARSSCSSA